MSAPLLVARNLSKTRRDSERSFKVTLPDLVLVPGARLALAGENGSGKSTLLALLALATGPDRSERFDFAGTDIAAAWSRGDQRRLAALRAGAYLPQRDGCSTF